MQFDTNYAQIQLGNNNNALNYVAHTYTHTYAHTHTLALAPDLKPPFAYVLRTTTTAPRR